MKQRKGYIYILTNPSFPEYVKIGFSHNPKERLACLNRSECVPFAFRLYATYEVNSEISDKRLHALIDKLNPDLRSIENFQGRQRVREFFAMSPEDAFSLLEAMAEIHGCRDKLKKYKKSSKEQEQEDAATEIKTDSAEKRKPFTFGMLGIRPGEIVHFVNNPEITVTVIDDRKVEFNGETTSLSGVAQKLLGSKWGVQGPRYFTYNGRLLTDLRDEKELELVVPNPEGVSEENGI